MSSSTLYLPEAPLISRQLRAAPQQSFSDRPLESCLHACSWVIGQKLHSLYFVLSPVWLLVTLCLRGLLHSPRAPSQFSVLLFKILPIAQPQAPVSSSSTQQDCRCPFGLSVPVLPSRKCIQVEPRAVTGHLWWISLLVRIAGRLCLLSQIWK